MKNLVQFESNKNFAYYTFSFNYEHEFGFVCINLSQEFVSHVSFEDNDNFSDYMDGLGMDEETCQNLINLPVGERMQAGECIYVRLW